MAKKINKFSATMCLSEEENYLKIEPENIHPPFNISYPFTVPLKREVISNEENNAKLNHFLDYSKANYPLGNIGEIYKNNPEQRKILSMIEHGVSLVAKLIADRGLKERRIKIEIASDRETEEYTSLRTGKPPTYKNNCHTIRKQIP